MTRLVSTKSEDQACRQKSGRGIDVSLRRSRNAPKQHARLGQWLGSKWASRRHQGLQDRHVLERMSALT
eukprot:6609939-Alexandrium_andersonii.AAC.1